LFGTIKTNRTKAPLYIVHGLGSTVFKFYDFANQLDDQQPVFGFQAKGVDGIDKPAESIEAMASEYVAELLKHNSDGPYNLSGYSMGGIVAFEMARQLAIIGKKVNVLAVFDSFIVEHEQMNPGLQKTISKSLSRIKKFVFTFQLLFTRPKRTIDHKVFTIKRQLSALLGRPIGNETGLDENFDQIGKIMSIHRQAVSNYQLKKQDIAVHLFKARVAATYLDDFEFLGWKPFTDKLIVHKIDGDHTQIFDTSINHRFAKSLQHVLDASKAGKSKPK
jgi:thioesterase domain-containing protein